MCWNCHENDITMPGFLIGGLIWLRKLKETASQCPEQHVSDFSTGKNHSNFLLHAIVSFSIALIC